MPTSALWRASSPESQRPFRDGAASSYCNDAHRNNSTAAKPSAVRTACSLAHICMSSRLSGPAFAGSIAISLLLVGMMPRRVYGQFETRTRAPSSHSQTPVCHHANNPKRNPATASGACIANPRLYAGFHSMSKIDRRALTLRAVRRCSRRELRRQRRRRR